MKSLFAALMVALLLVGCDQSPVDATSSNTQTEATFSELSMYKTTLEVSAGQLIVADSGKHQHDSLRNVRMLDSLKAYLLLTDEQFTSVKEFGATLFTSLEEIRTQVQAGTITRDSARTLVQAARTAFISSVKSILTANQLTALDTWIAKFWEDRGRGGRGPGGHGGHGGGHGGHGGPGGHDGNPPPPPGGGPGGGPGGRP